MPDYQNWPRKKLYDHIAALEAEIITLHEQLEVVTPAQPHVAEAVVDADEDSDLD